MENMTDTQDRQKKFQSAFVLFFIGQIFLIVGAFSIGSKFKFLPAWIEYLAFFVMLGYIFLIISVLRIYRYNQNFKNSAIAMGFTSALTIIGDIASKSTEDFYIYWAKGFNWSSSITLCIFYVYFFLGCYDYFTAEDQSEAMKHSRTGFIVFPILFITQSLLEAGPDFPIIKYNLIANRVCVYSSWIMSFVIYFFVIALLANIVIYMHKLKKKEGEINETSKAS